IPLIRATGIGSAQSRTTGAIVLGGQTLSLLLTLLLVPVAYSVFDDVVAWRARRRAGRGVEDKGERELEALVGAAPQAAAAEEWPRQAGRARRPRVARTHRGRAPMRLRERHGDCSSVEDG